MEILITASIFPGVGEQMDSATIRAEFGEEKYPVGRFILDRARSMGMSRSDLVNRLGYRDIGSGNEALSAVLLSGLVPPQVGNILLMLSNPTTPWSGP